VRYHIEFIVVRSKDEVKVDRHFGDVKKLAYFVLIALLAQCGHNVSEYAITMCK